MSTDNILQRAHEYCRQETHPLFKKQVEDLIAADNVAELQDRFYTDLEFGTGGLRGVIGGGFNRMNPLNVQKATEGLAQYVLEAFPGGKNLSAVIAFDSRHYSDLFAEIAALVFATYGITCYVFTAPRPTPMLSFAIRYLKAKTGIVLTASHNPPEYNGYKAYWDDGSQIISPHDAAIIEKVRTIKETKSLITKLDAVNKKLLVYIDEEIDAAYTEMIVSKLLRPDLGKEKGSMLSCVYTPLHGTGYIPLSRAFKKAGYTLDVVERQKDPNGDFPTVSYPNPEVAEALELAVLQAKENNADLVLATDPDADRLGIGILKDGECTLLTGNQLGVLFTDYLLATLKETGSMPNHPLIIKTIVTTELQRLVAEHYGALCVDTLTGFKYICSVMRENEQGSTPQDFILGNEESYGYLIEDEVRDKDGISAALLAAEMALYCKTKNKTILSRLEEIYRQFGFFEDSQISKVFRGEQGREIIKQIMNTLRENPPKVFAGIPVARIKDYQKQTTTDCAAGDSAKNIALPVSNVLQFLLDDATLVSVRPSGTEPKIKFYISVSTSPGQDLGQMKETAKKKTAVVAEYIHSITQEAK
ncbi:MAG: phospho-sugar mutase [Spirochaetales bacterium]|nr:phospho-sugar mutase [Spirochaetales bacterium]